MIRPPRVQVDASMVSAYFTIQPIGAVLTAMAVIAATPDTSHYGLVGPGKEDLGAIAVFLGVGKGAGEPEEH